MSNFKVILKCQMTMNSLFGFQVIVLALRPSCCLLPSDNFLPLPLLSLAPSGSTKSKPFFKHQVSLADIPNILNTPPHHVYTSLLKILKEGKLYKG